MKNVVKRRTKQNDKTVKAVLLGTIFLLLSCSQVLNWRETSVGDSGVSIWLPCKPNIATRQIPLSEDRRVGEISINLIECEKEGVQYAVSYMDMNLASRVDAIRNKKGQIDISQWMKLWEKASLQALGIKEEVQVGEWNELKKKLNPGAQTTRVKNSSGLEAEFIWFGYEGTLYQVALYSMTPLEKNKELVKTFTTSLQVK